MSTLSGRERIGRILARRPVDRIGLYEHIWSSTIDAWIATGDLTESEDVADHFDFDIAENNPFDMKADTTFGLQVIETQGDIELVRDGNGALFRRKTDGISGHEYVSYRVNSQEEWEEFAKPLLSAGAGRGAERIRVAAYRTAKKRASDSGRFFCLNGLNVFELMRTICGHENMFLGMGLDPDWIHDMVTTYTDLTIALQETLFSVAGAPDGIWYSEDLGYKGTPFISNEMYGEFIAPAHTRLVSFAHSHGIPVILHSCGMIEPMLPLILETGIDCIEAMEVKAGMDLIRLHRQYGDRLSFIGGIDARILSSEDRYSIETELERIIPTVMKGYGYVLHSDHSIPDNVPYENYRRMRDYGLEIGRYDTSRGSS